MRGRYIGCVLAPPGVEAILIQGLATDHDIASKFEDIVQSRVRNVPDLQRVALPERRG